MSLIDTFDITAGGLTAQRIRLLTVSSNMANARTTRTDDGGPYRRRLPIFEATQNDPFGETLEREMSGVRVMGIHESEEPPVIVYDPSHPDADEEGYVAYPDVNVLDEMVDMMTTARTYEANTSVINVTGDMALQALEIGR